MLYNKGFNRVKKRLSFQSLNSIKPPQLLAGIFAFFILIGTVLLLLPISTYNGISFIDALFTATSAACVTGLMTLNISEFTTFGKIVIMLLIQIGGLGIMTFGVLFTLVMGRALSFKQSLVITEAFDESRKLSTKSLLLRIVVMTFTIEFIGWVLLFLRWLPDYTTKDASFYALFHAVSAFCNAGITFFDNSLMSFNREKWIPYTISFLSFSGSFGFIGIMELYLWVKSKLFNKRKRARLSLQTKIISWYNLLIIVISAILIAPMEAKNLFADMDILSQVDHALFLTTCSRTSGFNTIDIASLTNGTLLIVMIIMFIGASPGSCGGGIKVTTFAVLTSIGKARFFALSKPSSFDRTIPDLVVRKAISVLFISVQIVAVYILLLMLSETGGVQETGYRDIFLPIVFEVISAFGTVGLSMGITADLSEIGKLLIVSLMFIGRLGPLTITLAVAKDRPKGEYQYSEENMMVG